MALGTVGELKKEPWTAVFTTRLTQRFEAAIVCKRVELARALIDAFLWQFTFCDCLKRSSQLRLRLRKPNQR